MLRVPLYPLPRFAAGSANGSVPLAGCAVPNASKSAANASLANASLNGLSLDGGGLDVRPVGKAASNGVGVPEPTPPDEGVAAVVGTAVGDSPMLLPDPA